MLFCTAPVPRPPQGLTAALSGLARLESAGQGLNLAPGLISSPHTCRAGFYLQQPREEAASMVRLTWGGAGGGGSVLTVGFWCLLKLEIPLAENLALIGSC